MKVGIIIPTHNEEKRIERTLIHYISFFDAIKTCDVTFITVLNGCNDNTYEIVSALQKKYNSIEIINKTEAGKGFAVIQGFKYALAQNIFDLIGFVDADMATLPMYFYDLIDNISKSDGIIASRYCKEAKVVPKRPFIKNWGRKLIYNPLTKIVLGLPYTDFQCGAKLFKPHVLQTIIPHVKRTQWTFDVEILYLCKKHNFSIKEIPTTWYDQEDSKLQVFNSGIKMLSSIIKVRIDHSRFFQKMKGKNEA